MVISNPFFVGFMGFHYFKKIGGRGDNDAVVYDVCKI